MMHTIRRSTFVCGLLGVLALGTGCGAIRGMSAKHAYLEQQTQSHVYHQPLKVIWPQARQLLFERGFEVKDTDTSNAETEWRVSPSDNKQRERYLLSGIEVSDDECKVQFIRATEFKDGANWGRVETERDLGMEYELIQKADPDAHAHIEAEGDRRAEKAKND